MDVRLAAQKCEEEKHREEEENKRKFKSQTFDKKGERLKKEKENTKCKTNSELI